MLKIVIAISASTLSIASLQAEAQSVQAYTFTSVGISTTAPTLSGSFTLLNTAGNYSLTAFSSNYQGYAYDLTNTGLSQSGSSINIGGLINGVNILESGTNDFATGFFVPQSTAPTEPQFNGDVVTPSGGFVDLKFTFSPVLANASAVPEAATWAMMMVGLGVVGGSLRRRRSVSTRVSFG